MIANLPWYDLPELRRAYDAFWTVLARHLRRAGVADAPGRLEREGDARAQWRDPALLLSQACGYDVVATGAARALRVVGTPRFDLPEGDAGRYASRIAVRDDHAARNLADLAGARCAINEASSHSGHHALRALVAPLASGRPFFDRVVESGSHVASLALLTRGAVDVAAIDCMTWALLAEHRPSAIAGLRTIGLTPAVAAPPFVTSARASDDRVARIRDALDGAFADPRAMHARSDLRLAGVERSSRCRYRELAVA